MILNVIVPVGSIILVGVVIGSLAYFAFRDNIKDRQRCGD